MNKISMFQRPDPLPKYFAIDVDGTFYTSNEDSFKKNVEAFKLLKDKNITPFFCTGKGIESSKNIINADFFNQTGYNGYPGIYNSGSLVYDSDGNVIKIEKFSEDFLNKFYQYATINNFINKVVYSTDNKLHCTTELAENPLNFFIMLKFDDIHQITYDELKHKNVVLIYFFEHHLDDIEILNEVTYSHYDEYNLTQITPKGVSKKEGVEALLNYFNSNENECAYIGDGTNDIPALELCKISFAVGNATEEAKRKAKWVLDLNYDQGAFEKAVKLLVND